MVLWKLQRLWCSTYPDSLSAQTITTFQTRFRGSKRGTSRYSEGVFGRCPTGDHPHRIPVFTMRLTPAPSRYLKPFGRLLMMVLLVGSLVLSHSGISQAARGGRAGGGSFRSPSRSFNVPSRSYNSGSYSSSYYGGGGGFGFPIFFGGGGGLYVLIFMIVIAILIAGILIPTSQRHDGGGDEGDIVSINGGDDTNGTATITQVQVGLLASARDVQRDLERLARTADTGSNAGLAQLLQESTLALLRNPQYWVYGNAESQRIGITAAENVFNRLVMAERSHFSGEDLSNVAGQVRQGATETAAGALPAPGEYIVVTLIVGSLRPVNLGKVSSGDDLQQVLRQLGATSVDDLLALEVLWQPLREDEVLTAEDLLTSYPDLKNL